MSDRLSTHPFAASTMENGEDDGDHLKEECGVFGIFGHGNVTGFGQALEEFGGSKLPFFQAKNEQAMVHSAVAFAKA